MDHDPHPPLAVALCEAMAAIHRRGWCDGTGGNFSCVAQRHPLELLMAPSGVDKGSLRPDQLIWVDGSAQVLRGSGKASAETLLHLAIVKTAGAGAVLHTHSQAATLLSAMAEESQGPTGFVEIGGLEMLKGLEGITSHTAKVAIPVLTNDQDIKRLSLLAEPLISQAPHGLLIAGHGLYAWGPDLTTAKRHLEILEFLLEQQWRQILVRAISPPNPPTQSPRPIPPPNPPAHGL